MIDLHCHILPGTDDGPACMEDSLAMAQSAVNDGIEIIVATPHTRNGVYAIEPGETRERVSDLMDHLSRNSIPLTVLPGAEVHLTADIVDNLVHQRVSFINDNGVYLLVEFPFQVLPVGYKEVLFQLKLEGITPVIAHPERQAVFQRRMEELADLVRMGCLVQVTAASVTGEFGSDIMRCTHGLLEQRIAHVIASDAHSPDARPPVLSKAVDTAAGVLGSRDEAERMVIHTPRQIVSGHAVDVAEMRPPVRKRKRFFKFW